MTELDHTRRAGVLFALGAYGSWGFFPLYFRHLQSFPALEIVLHRSVWSVPFLLLLVLAGRRLGPMLAVLRRPRNLAMLALSAAILAGNWLIFASAVEAHEVLQVSLGYYINPLVTVLLAVTVLGERLSRPQMAAILLAAAGVAVMAWQGGGFPWVALSIAVSFALYGLLRKTMVLGAMEGLLGETALLLPFALGGLVWLGAAGRNHFPGAGLDDDLLLVASGVVTTLPLIFFAAAARRLTLVATGLFQYLAPTLHLLLAVFLFGEVFTTAHAATFALIWSAVALFAVDSLRRGRTKKPGKAPPRDGTDAAAARCSDRL